MRWDGSGWRRRPAGRCESSSQATERWIWTRRRPGGLQARLEPFVARGIYLTLNAAGDETLRTNAMRLLATTEGDTLVVDVKGDRGRLLYLSGAC